MWSGNAKHYNILNVDDNAGADVTTLYRQKSLHTELSLYSLFLVFDVCGTPTSFENDLAATTL